jgi:hypothetical protein
VGSPTQGVRGGPAAGWRNAAAYLRDPLPYLEGVARTGGPVVNVPFPRAHSFHFLTWSAASLSTSMRRL